MKNSLQKEDFELIISKATVDCYGLYEELSCISIYLQDELIFPFKINLLGLTLDVIAVTEQQNLPKLVVLRERAKYSIDMTNCEVVDKKSRNHLLIESYKHWFSLIF